MDLEAEYASNRLRDSLAGLQQLLTKKVRSTFDTSETRISFCVFIIDYEQVESRFTPSMMWIMNKSRAKLIVAAKDMHGTIFTSSTVHEITGVALSLGFLMVFRIGDTLRRQYRWAQWRLHES